MVSADQIRVEVVYALPDDVFLVSLEVPSGSTVRQAIELSGVLTRFPEIDLSQNEVGIFGKLSSPDAVLGEGDRVEIYRGLKVDPKEARRRRAMKKGRL